MGKKEKEINLLKLPGWHVATEDGGDKGTSPHHYVKIKVHDRIYDMPPSGLGFWGLSEML